MGYRISYGKNRRAAWLWRWIGLCGAIAAVGTGSWAAMELVPAGEGLYDALARMVGEMIRGAH